MPQTDRRSAPPVRRPGDGPAVEPGPAPRRSPLAKLGDKIFPVRPGPVPPWSRVVTLMFIMSIIWELMWLVTFVLNDPTHDFLAAWGRSSQLLPIAIVLAGVGAVPGFWLMRRRIAAVNVKAGLPADGKVSRATVTPHTPRATEHASSRARRRHSAKKRVRR